MLRTFITLSLVALTLATVVEEPRKKFILQDPINDSWEIVRGFISGVLHTEVHNAEGCENVGADMG